MARVSPLVFTALVLSSSAAHAAPYDLYGAGARGAAMGAQTAAAPGAHALHYNLSQLAGAPAGMTLGTMATFGRPRILLKERPGGYDVPDLGPPAASPGTALELRERADSEVDAPLAAVSIGVVAPLVFEGLHAGLLIFLPMPAPVTLTTRYADERERYFSNTLAFERLGPRAHHLDLQFGLAYQVTRWLSVGVGATYLPGFAVNTGIYLPDSTDQARADINSEVTTDNGFGLLAGITLNLPEDLTVGVSFRDAIALRLGTQNEVQINGVTRGEPILQQARWTPIYSPGRAAVGLGWSPGAWTIAADLRYTFWGSYEDSQGQPAGFTDVVSGAVGAEYRYSSRTALRAGLGFEPTPVPPQTGRTNYVDNAMFNLSVGAGHKLELGESKFEVAWSVRVQPLVRRETFKSAPDDVPACTPDVTVLCDEVPDDLVDHSTGRPFPEAQGLQTGNPGFPGWVSGGWMGSIGAELRY